MPDVLTSRNPASGSTLGELEKTSPGVLPSLFEAARRAQSEWAGFSLSKRSKKLLDLRELILERSPALERLISLENGKPVLEALTSEILPSVDLLTYYAKSATKILRPHRIPMGLMKHRKSHVEFWPVGVAAVISPWNYPLLLPLGQIAPILAAGNAVIFKPSEITPLVGLEIQKLVDDAGFPSHLMQTVIGDGELGRGLIAQKPDKIFFTGSAATGKKVMTQAAEHLIPVNLELGGKDALIVLEDADLDYATSAALWGGYANSGQICASLERLLVHESIAAPFKQLLARKAGLLRAGDPQSLNTDLGAITFENQKRVYAAHLEEARSKNAEIVFGGNFSNDRTRLEPTLVSGHGIESLQVYTEETFGPVLALTTFKTDDEAVAKANASPYGLVSSILTRDLARARRLASRLEVGTVIINEVIYTAGLGETPWGGVKDSGMGRTHGAHGLLEAVHPRHVHEPRLPGLWFKSPWWFPYSAAQKALFEALMGLYRRSWAAKLAAAVRLAARAATFLFREPRI